MRATEWAERNSKTAGKVIRLPTAWEPTAQEWVLFDLDGIRGLAEENVEEVGRAIVRSLRRNPECSGRCVVVQTGPHGIHVWGELREV